MHACRHSGGQAARTDSHLQSPSGHLIRRGVGFAQVMLARKLPPGGSIKLTETPVKVTAPDGYEEPVITVPQSMMSPAKVTNAPQVGRSHPLRILTSRLVGSEQVPRATATGETLERSVLGSAPEYDAMMASKRAGLDTSADFEEELSAAEGDSLLEDYRMRQDQAREAESQLRLLKDEKVMRHNHAAVGKRKVLIHEQMAKGKETRALAKWEKQSRDWERFKVRMSHKLGKTVDELVFSRAEEWREMLEDFELLTKAEPPEEASNPDQWEMSLRNAWTKYVSVGNSLSGLYLPIAMRSDDDMHNFSRIQRPEGARMRSAMTQQKMMTGKTFMVSTKTWRDSEFYAKKKQKFRKNLAKLWPHEPLFEELEVHGHRPGTAGATASTLNSARSQRTEPDVAAAEGPIADPVPERATDLPAGPDLTFESRRVMLECTCGKIASGTVSARNSGSTALYYTWRKLEKPNVIGKKPDGVQRLWFAAKGGVVLPGRTVTFDFNFKSDTPGAWTETWELTTQPTLPGGAIRVSAKGIALSRVENAVQREALETKLAASIKMSTVSMMLGDLVPELDLDRGETPAVIKQVTDPEGMAQQAALKLSPGETDVTEELFNSQNRRLHLFFSPDLFPSFQALAQQVFGLLNFPQADREWDLSVDSLWKLIKGISDERAQQKCLDTLAALVKIATIPPTEGSLFYAIGHTLLGDLADATEVYGNKTKGELQELGQYPADPAPPEEGQDPEPPPELTDGEQGQVAAFVEKAEAEVKELLGATVDKFESLCIAGEVESRMMALQHFGLIPQEEHEEEEDDDDETASNVSGFSGKVPPIGSAGELEQYSMMSALNQSANMTGSQLYSSLVDGGGHTPHEQQ